MRRPSRIQSNRISNTPSRSGPMNVFGLTIVVSTAATRQSASASIFDSPYHPTPTSGSSSSIGCFSGTPYTAVDEMNTTRRTPASRAARRTFSVPVTFTERIESRDAWIGSAAAAWTTTSAPSTSCST